MTIDLLQLCEFNAAYARAIDADALEQWPAFFCDDCRYRITNAENFREGLPAGVVYADSRAMLEDRVSALREANIYEKQRLRHIVGMPFIVARGDDSGDTGADDAVRAETPFIAVRVMHSGQSTLFASGAYHDRFVRRGGPGGALLLAERVVVCDSTATDTLMALPL